MRYRIVASMLVALLCCSCGGLGDFSRNLSKAILDHDDPELVKYGVPSYLLLMDGLVEGDPEDGDLLAAAAALYAMYAGAFVEDPQRAALLARRAESYGERALCEQGSAGCGLKQRSYEDFVVELKKFDDEDDVPALYAFAISWLLAIRANSADWGALADLPKVEQVLRQILALDETYQQGSAHLYLGMLQTVRPPALGGNPEEGRSHFERALALSNGRNLTAKVEYARCYARLMYDRPLHDRLLREVLRADTKAEGFTLFNTLAKEEAKKLLKSAEEYF